MRKLIGRFIEWALGYDHVVNISGRNPKEGHSGDAGYDMFVSGDTVIPAHGVANVPTELHIDPQDQIWFQIVGRSSTFHKRGLQIIPAVIDRGYRGEMFAACYNPNDRDIIARKGERLAQVIPFRLIPCKFVHKGYLSNSARGRNGFGSTGGLGSS